MSASKFVPLTGQLIDEGEFLGDLNLELSELQQAIVKYCRTHGEKAKGAVACLDIKIAIGVAKVDDEAFSVKVSMKATHPKRPATVSLAMGGTDDDGNLALFVRAAGGDKTEPRQGKLFTQRGAVIDPETGEVAE